MVNEQNFLIGIHNKFANLDILFHKILKEEGIIKDDILVKKGFLIKKYSINYSAINIKYLEELKEELQRILVNEVYLQKELDNNMDSLKQIEKEYSKMTKKKLHVNLLPKHLKEALYYSNLMITRVKQLTKLLEDGLKLHKGSLGKDTEIFFASIEHIANQIMEFIHLLGQLSNKILSFEKESYYPEPRTYGRVMALHEFKKTVKDKRLSSSKDPTPVFDSPDSVRRKMLSMSEDEMRNLFVQIGVKGGVHVVFFQTKLKPINHDKPILQRNKLREYKFPKGINIDILKAA